MSGLAACTSSAALRDAWYDRRRRLLKTCFGPDRVSATTFDRSLDRQIREIQHRIADGFRPHGLLALAKPKDSGGNRIICVPTFADRLLQFSLLNELRPRLRAMGVDNEVAYGISPGRERSVLEARKFACRARNERPWVYKADVHKFFDNVKRNTLREAVSRAVRKTTLHPLLHSFLSTEITDGAQRGWRAIVAEAGIQSGLGVRQGMPLSPLYAGIYLRDVDRQLIKRRAPVARYVDDIVAFFKSEAEAAAFHSFLKSVLDDVGLKIGEPGAENSKTVIYSPAEPAAFLGMELSRVGTSPYQLRIAPSNIAKIVGEIEKNGDVGELLEKKVTLTTMGGYFRSVTAGYANAYSAAQNRDELRDAINNAAAISQGKVLRDLLGPKQLRSLSPKALQFLGVEPAMLFEAGAGANQI